MHVLLETEDRQELARTSAINCLEAILPALSDASFPLARYIDLYGDTVFNMYQVRDLLTEWDRLSNRATEKNELATLAECRALMEKCLNGHHTYIRFHGD
jgi:hypothetical protein